MFFFMGGISPKIKIIDKKPRICPVCGLAQAYFKRVDHYLNIFFIPVFRVKKGEPFLMCERCEREVSEMGNDYKDYIVKQGAKCSHCGRTLHPRFRFCPYCGQKINISS